MPYRGSPLTSLSKWVGDRIVEYSFIFIIPMSAHPNARMVKRANVVSKMDKQDPQSFVLLSVTFAHHYRSLDMHIDEN